MSFHRKTSNRHLGSKVVDNSQFVKQQGSEKDLHNIYMANGKKSADKLTKNDPMKTPEKTFSNMTTARKLNRKNNPVNPIRIKTQGHPPFNKNLKRFIMLAQMRNHSISSAYDMKNESGNQALDTSRKLKEWHHVLENFANKEKFGSDLSLSSGSITSLMNRIGFSKYGFKIINESPYATNEGNLSRKRRKVSRIVPRHNCFTDGVRDTRVPSYMGWNWTRIFYDKVYQGWRPGAIPKNIRHLMCYFNGPCSCMPSDLKTCPTYQDKLRQSMNNEVEKFVPRKPTLKIVRKDGVYLVSMNPLKSSKDLNGTENPYLDDCQPIQFQIALNRKKRESNDYGGSPSSERVFCDDDREMQNLLKILADECQNDSEFYDLAKTLCAKESDLSIEFIAPGANLKDTSILRDEAYKGIQYETFIKDGVATVKRSIPNQKKIAI